MENRANGFPDDWSQELDDLIDATVGDMDSRESVNRLEEAIRAGLLGTQSQVANAYMVLGTRYEDLEEIDKAIDRYSHAIQLNIENPMCYYWRGELLIQQNRGKEARLDFEKALSFPAPNRLMSPEFEQAQDFLKQIGDL